MEKHPAKLIIRRDNDIHEMEGGWFHARWHFSFDQYYDPANMGIGTMRVFNHDTLRPGAVWPLHPHKDVEGISYIPKGEFEHKDNLGNGGVITEGGVQRMTLGSGAWHSECNHSKTEPVQFIQMWIMPDKKGLKPGVEQKQYGLEDRRNKLLQILRPVGEEGDGVTVHQKTHMHVSHLEPGRALIHSIKPGFVGYFYLIDGELELNSLLLKKGDAAKIVSDGTLDMEAKKVSEFILVDTIKR